MLPAPTDVEKTIFLTRAAYTSQQIEEVSGVGPQTVGDARKSGDLIGSRIGRQYIHPAHSVAKWLTSRANGEIEFVALVGGGVDE